MNRVVEYHSLNECLFFFLLELDSSTVRYYVQQINMGIQFFDDQGNKKTWSYVPDVLVFKNGFVPLLYQIKEEIDQLQLRLRNVIFTARNTQMLVIGIIQSYIQRYILKRYRQISSF